MATKQELIETFHRIACEVTERKFPELKAESVIDKLGIDSLHLLEIVGSMERELKIQLPDDELVGIQTVGDLVSLVEKKVNGIGAA